MAAHSEYAQAYDGLSAQAASCHARFVKATKFAADRYQAAESQSYAWPAARQANRVPSTTPTPMEAAWSAAARDQTTVDKSASLASVPRASAASSASCSRRVRANACWSVMASWPRRVLMKVTVHDSSVATLVLNPTR